MPHGASGIPVGAPCDHQPNGLAGSIARGAGSPSSAEPAPHMPWPAAATLSDLSGPRLGETAVQKRSSLPPCAQSSHPADAQSAPE